MLVRRAVNGNLGLIPAAKKLQDELLTPSAPAVTFGDSGALDAERKTVAAFKKVVLMVLGTAMQTYGEKLSDQQEVLSYIADIIAETYAAESSVLRALAANVGANSKDADLHETAARVFVNDSGQRLEAAARSALAGMSDGDTLRTLLAALRRVLKLTPVNTIALRRKLADAAIQKGGYIL
ncbi:MAG TPA: hypothetical protein VFD21_05180 [Vicinamibacterales bacterium]|nr:hypothetical protein [Vicinamibacterales bacterium]